jgi:hypothetical protein
MMQALVKHRFDGHPLGDVDGYQQHVDSVAGGLFSAFLSAVPNQCPATKTKVAMLIGLFGHIVDPSYSQLAWELTTVLHSAGMSDRQLRGLSSKGLGMCTSKLRAHENLMQGRHDHHLAEICSDSNCRLVLVTDDFHQIELSRGLPRKKWEVFGGAPCRQCDSQGSGGKRIGYSSRPIQRMFGSDSILCRIGGNVDPEQLECIMQQELQFDETEIFGKNCSDFAAVLDEHRGCSMGQSNFDAKCDTSALF